MDDHGDPVMAKYRVTSPEGQTYDVTAPDGASQEQILAYVKANAKSASAFPVPPSSSLSPDEATQGSPFAKLGVAGMNFALGAASPFVGTAQGIAALLGEKEKALEFGKKLEEGTKAIRQSIYGKEGGSGMSPAELAGNILSPLGLAALKAMPPSPSLIGKMGQGAAIGAGYGATTPITSGTPEDFGSTKALQTIAGAATGGIIPVGVGASQAIAGGMRNLKNMIVEGGEKPILTEYQKAILGPVESRQKVIDALEQAKELIPGSKPTVAQALTLTPEGSPLIAHQSITAGTPGGASAQFGERAMKQKVARKVAATTRNDLLGPQRDAALEAANANGGVPSTNILKSIDILADEPGKRASEVVSKTLGNVREKIASLAGTDGKIDARDLYTVRKEIGNTIQVYAKESANWDKKLTAGLESDIQKGIDNAIEGAGGMGWKDYLEKYAARSQAIADDLTRAKLALKPVQKTNLQGGINVSEEMRTHFPQLLSRPMMLANFALRKMGGTLEPRLDAEAVARYLTPSYLADALKEVPSNSRYKIAEALLRYGPVIGGMAAGRSLE